jgi:hypothetical protein
MNGIADIRKILETDVVRDTEEDMSYCPQFQPVSFGISESIRGKPQWK